jgi:hypothetical protein
MPTDDELHQLALRLEPVKKAAHATAEAFGNDPAVSSSLTRYGEDDREPPVSRWFDPLCYWSLEYGLKKWPTSFLLLHNWGNEASSYGSVRADVGYIKIERVRKEWNNPTFEHLFEIGWSSDLMDECLIFCTL